MDNIFIFAKNKLYFAAWMIVALPLFVGTLLFITWIINYDQALQEYMVKALVAGYWALCIGLLLTMIYYVVHRNQAKVISKVAKLIGFYIFSFLTAVVLALVTANILTASEIIIVNKSSFNIVNAYLVGGNTQKINIAPISPNSTKVMTTHFDTDDSIGYVITIGEEKNRGTLFGYVTSGMANYGKITINNDKKITTLESYTGNIEN